MNKLLKTEFTGELNIGGIIISCAVLEDGQRVLSERSMGDAIGTKASATYWKQKREGKIIGIPQYIAAPGLQSYIDEALKVKLNNSIPYISKSGSKANGIPADILPEICDIWIKAKDDGVLTKAQEKTAEKAYILLKGFANVGIIALVDEATGYQEIRNRLALQAILDKYLKVEYAKWAKRFPNEFYMEMFRLNNWQYNQMRTQRPSVIGRYTNNIIYERLAPGVLVELRKRNPKDEKGNRKVKHHQWLTEDIGHPKLQAHLNGIIALMKAASNWSNFMRMVERAFPRLGHTIPINFGDEIN